ncbi:DEAD/DEAH box helicase family protein [Vibrio diabolicus]|uniref:DEAD/DEAH box helicase family protein n=1 Tax=Vibrio diabolicus TaxID=50719 RepID=UPI0013DFAE94|nr:DEAD/DEAH box helicase family protein [Vibrio diabolicus]QOV29456.1 DEAD/DEAH box helicase family protein [Vibrio diabolicus]HCE3234319.1 DEAD/DEAH box helicase family protein [Vibrio parahaemolyticus]
MINLVQARCGAGKTNVALKNIKPFTIFAVPTLRLFESITQRSNHNWYKVSYQHTTGKVAEELLKAIIEQKPYILCTHEAVSRLLDQGTKEVFKKYHLVIDEQPKLIESSVHSTTDSDIDYFKSLIKFKDGSNLVTSSETKEALKRKIENIENGKNSTKHNLPLWNSLYAATYESSGRVFHVHQGKENELHLGLISCKRYQDVSKEFNSVTIMTADDIRNGLGCIVLSDGFKEPVWAKSLEKKYKGKIKIIPLSNRRMISTHALDSEVNGITVKERMIEIARKYNAEIILNNKNHIHTENPIPVVSHGLNDWNEAKAIACIYSCRPSPALEEALNMFHPRAVEAFLRTNYLDVVHQGCARGRMRNNKDQICIVPDLDSAEYLLSKCENGFIDTSEMIDLEDSGRGKYERKQSVLKGIFGDNKKLKAFRTWCNNNKIKYDVNTTNPSLIKLASVYNNQGAAAARKEI